MISDFFLALLLALIQGLTEFLPVSSSAHLLFPSLLFGAKDFGIVFDISVHAGTLAAVIYYFKKEILGLLHAWMPWSQNRSKENFSLGYHVVAPDVKLVNSRIQKGYNFIAFSTDFYFMSENAKGCLKNITHDRS
jgi:undecaprenyl pyrophosphate phosphatase UppP